MARYRFALIGGFDDERVHFLENLELPVLEDLPVIAEVAGGLDEVVKNRGVVAVVGPRGCGKTFAIRLALDDFGATEQEKARQDAKYARRRVVVAPLSRAKSRRDALLLLLRAVTESEPVIRSGRRGKTDDELFADLTTALPLFSVRALVFDEAETLNAATLQLVRDLVSSTQSVDNAGVSATKEGFRQRPAGLGVLFVGTDHFGDRVKKWEEAGRRLRILRQVHGIPGADVPEAYRRLFSPCAAHAATAGEKAWEKVVLGLTKGANLPIGDLVNHIRIFARQLAVEHNVRTVGDMEFDEAIWEFTWLVSRSPKAAA
jgi:hypothetical protein